jgi:hypothetical protein
VFSCQVVICKVMRPQSPILNGCEEKCVIQSAFASSSKLGLQYWSDDGSVLGVVLL